MFKPGMKRDSNNGFLQIISNSPLFRAGKLNLGFHHNVKCLPVTPLIIKLGEAVKKCFILIFPSRERN